MRKHRARTAGIAAVTVVAVAILGTAAHEARSKDVAGSARQETKLDPAGWYTPGQGGKLAKTARYADELGQIEVLNLQGDIDTKGHPFFEPIGTNGRACVSCHQPSNGMSVSVAAIRARWAATQGKDPIFAAVDGSNCPNLPQEKEGSHSLLLGRGLFRVALPWPRTAGPDGTPVKPEFTIEVVRDPTGCNTDPVYGLKAANKISVYRRPRVVANLKYVAMDAGGEAYTGTGPFNAKRLAMVMDRDPDSGAFSSMNIMSDARAPSLRRQAVDASIDHLQVDGRPTDEQLTKIVAFESQVFMAQGSSNAIGDLIVPGGPEALGARAVAESPAGVLGDNYGKPVFKSFEMWKESAATHADPKALFRASVARGYDIYFNKPFWVKDSVHINTAGLGNPIKRTCATCHNLQMVGTDVSAGWVDIGTTNKPWAKEPMVTPVMDTAPELPLFKITCNPDARPHPFLGRVIYTQDPARALISGKCYDVGSVVMGQFRGLAARAPYFSNGSAEDLRALVDFYDRRYNIGFSEREKTDLINFLSVL